MLYTYLAAIAISDMFCFLFSFLGGTFWEIKKIKISNISNSEIAVL